MKTFNKILSALLAMILATPAYSEIYYIDPDAGSDSNSGMSTAQAWRSFPGTTTPADYTVNKNSSWGNGSTLPSGPITTANRVPFGSTFKVKSGTTFSSADGIGQTYFRGNDSTGFYGMNSNAVTAFTGQGIIIERDTTWGSGNVTIDASGWQPGIASWVIQLDGPLVDGKTTNGFYFINGPLEGLQIKEYTSNAVTYLPKFVNVQNVGFFKNALSLTNDDAGAGKGQFNVRGALGLRAKNIQSIASPTNFINGIILGDNGKFVTDGVVQDTYISGFQGDPVNNDSGIGIKALNSQVTFTNVISMNNLKGLDLGEQSSPTTLNPIYKVINSTCSSNSLFGIGFNSSGLNARTNVAFLYVVNSLISTNLAFGINGYSAPHQIVVAHSTFAYNGSAAYSGAESCNIRATYDQVAETNGVALYAKNNIFFRPYDAMFSSKYATEPTDLLEWKTDYNVYVRSATESVFMQWAYSDGTYFANIGYGSPWDVGTTTGQWYLWEGRTSAADLPYGSWHKNSDGFSTVLATGNGRNTDAFFNNFTELKPVQFDNGKNLTTEPWYIPEMGFDRLGNARTHWYAGAYDALTGPAEGGSGNAIYSGYPIRNLAPPFWWQDVKPIELVK